MKGPEFLGGSVGYGSSVLTAMALVTGVMRVCSLAWELPRATGAAKTKPKTKRTHYLKCLTAHLFHPPADHTCLYTDLASLQRIFGPS